MTQQQLTDKEMILEVITDQLFYMIIFLKRNTIDMSKEKFNNKFYEK